MPVLDQFNYQVSGQSGYSDMAIVKNQSVAQSFTAGYSGQLSRVDLVLGRTKGLTGTLEFSVRPMVDGAPSSLNALIQFSIDVATLPDAPLSASTPITPTALDLSSYDLSIEKGKSYAIALERNTIAFQPWVVWSDGRPPDGYVGGEVFRRSYHSGDWDPLGDTSDMEFATYILVPEPASMIAIASGALFLVIVCWKPPNSACPGRKDTE
ncbi:MAG: PEP-CTERM sorting domain-containing protein [Pirellulales bacterium]